MGRKSQVEAVYEFFGGQSTTLSQDAAAGASSITTVASLTVGATIEIDVSETVMGGTVPTPDVATIQSVTGTGPYTLNLVSPLLYAHTSGAIVAPFHSPPSTVFPEIKTVCRGEPFEKLEVALPLLYVTVPSSKEYRQAAQKKFIDHTITAVLLWETTGRQLGAKAESILMQYYTLLDQIGAKIRTNKILSTSSYPLGASIRFGEDFTVEEYHERLENSLIIVSTFKILSTEEVTA